MTGKQCFASCCFGNGKEKASGMLTYTFITFASVHRKTIANLITYMCILFKFFVYNKTN